VLVVKPGNTHAGGQKQSTSKQQILTRPHHLPRAPQPSLSRSHSPFRSDLLAKLLHRNLKTMATTTADLKKEAPLQVKAEIEPQWSRFLAGGAASATAEMLTLPIDITKVRLQAQRSGPATGGKPAVHYNGMLHAAQTMIKHEGPASLWNGATPALLRQVSYTSICMVLYEPLRNFFGANATQGANGEVPFINKFLAGGFAGAIGISIANPYVRTLLCL
jgi:hypothetical protein